MISRMLSAQRKKKASPDAFACINEFCMTSFISAGLRRRISNGGTRRTAATTPVRAS